MFSMDDKIEEKNTIEIELTVKVNGEIVALNDDEVSSILEQILDSNVSYSEPVFVRVYDA